MLEAQTGTVVEKLIESKPRLRYLDTAFGILREKQSNSQGEEISWKDLHKKVRPFSSGVELSDNVREVVVDFISPKIPLLKERISPLRSLGDHAILDALTHNWFEGIDEKVEGKRSEVLFSAMAHIVKRIENYAYKKVFENASQESLERLGLDFDTRDLLVSLLDTSIKADPLYIRFMAYAQLSHTPPGTTSLVALHLPEQKKNYTIVSLFPHETRFLAQRFFKIASAGGEWQEKDGGEIFRKYLYALSELYHETDIKTAKQKQKNVETLYGELLRSPFPIIMTPALVGYYKEPYLDPELKISITSQDTHSEETRWKNIGQAMSESLDILHIPQFAKSVAKKQIKSAITVGGFGVNITFNAVAQEEPSIVMFLNEQIRAYDRDFPEVVQKNIGSTRVLYGETISHDKKLFLEQMSRTNTILHEYSHSIYPDSSHQAKRLGRQPLTIVDEVKAEICYRSLVPSMIEKGALEGTKEEWAIGMLGSSLQMIRDQPKGDPYYYAASYALNSLFESGAVVYKDRKLTITDFDLYYEAQKSATLQLLALYQDPDMTEKKASAWIKKQCAPNEKVQEVLT